MGKKNEVKAYEWASSKLYEGGVICWDNNCQFLRARPGEGGAYIWEHGVELSGFIPWLKQGVADTLDAAKQAAIDSAAPDFDVMIQRPPQHPSQEILDELTLHYPDFVWSYDQSDKKYIGKDKVCQISKRTLAVSAYIRPDKFLAYAYAERRHVTQQGELHHKTYRMSAEAPRHIDAIAGAIAQYDGGWDTPDAHYVWCMEQRHAEIAKEIGDLIAKQAVLLQESHDLTRAITSAHIRNMEV